MLTDDKGNVTADRSVTLDFVLDVTQVDDPLTFNITTNAASINEGDYTGAPQDLAIAFTLEDEDSSWTDLSSSDFTVFYANSSGVAGDATDDFTVISDGSGGYSLQATGNLNYEREAGSTLTLVVEATAAAHQVQSPPVTVTLIDVNEPPTGITLNKISFLPGVNEVGTITVIDEDTNDAFRDYNYELTGEDAAQFALNQSTGAITFIGASAGLEGTSYDITLTATDNTNAAFTVTDDFTIYVGGLYLVPETGGSTPSRNDDSSIPMGEFSGSDIVPENMDGDEDTPIAHVRVSEGRYPLSLVIIMMVTQIRMSHSVMILAQQSFTIQVVRLMRMTRTRPRNGCYGSCVLVRLAKVLKRCYSPSVFRMCWINQLISPLPLIPLPLAKV